LGGSERILAAKYFFVADEESGSKHGIQYLLKQHGDIFQRGDFIVVPDAGVPGGAMIEVAEKSIF